MEGPLKESSLSPARTLLRSLGLLLFAIPLSARTQEPAAATTSPTEQSEVPDVPGLAIKLHGFNVGATFYGIHDSVTGWATLFTPAIGYSFNDIFSVDATLPIYMYRLAESRAARPSRTALLVNQRGELGDIAFGFHAQLRPRLFNYQATVAMTAPTGDEPYGLTTGRVTFDLTNHFERTLGRVTPTLDLGVGDSSTLVNRLVTKTYTSLGPLAHFQIGAGLQLPRDLFFEAAAYEQLPIGDQKVYGSSRNGRMVVVTGHNAVEDNGITTSLDIPVDRHTTLSGYYSRSLRLRVDTVGIGITYVLRSARDREPEPDVIDDLIR